MGFFVLSQPLIAVASCCIGNAVEARRIEQNHTEHGDNENKWSCGHRLNNADDQAVKIAAFSILSNEITFSSNLSAEAIVAKDNKRADG